MNKTINFDGYILILKKTSYEHDGSLAVSATTKEHELYATLTVNLPFPTFKNQQFFNINLYKGEELLQLLIAEGIVKQTNFEFQSGIVTYPMVKWNLGEDMKND